MSATGKALLIGARLGYGWQTSRLLVTAESPTDVVTDWVFGGAAPGRVRIPYSWFVQPLRWRPDPPINTAVVTSAIGATGRSVDGASVTIIGVRSFTADLHTLLADDPPALATHMVGAYPQPRQRCPTLTFDLLQHTPAERLRLLRCGIGQRITLTGTPADWPAGATDLVIEGVEHTIGSPERRLVWNVGPVVGAAAGSPGPWFRADASRADTGDTLAF